MWHTQYRSCAAHALDAARTTNKNIWPSSDLTRKLAISSALRSLHTRAAKPMWLDCDPGHDDAIALMVACSHPDIDLLGGAPKPLMRAHIHCAEIHGDSGLDACGGGRLFPLVESGPSLPKAALAIADAIRKVHTEGRGPLQLVCTGALTNTALAFMLFPELVDPAYVEVTLMGGAIGSGNTGPVQEFNIQTDPEAAHVVFESGVPLAMVPIEVTHTVLATPAVREQIGRLKTAFGKTTLDLLEFFTTSYREVFKFEHPPVHDPVAVVYVVQPELFKSEMMRVDVETSSSLSSGQTVCDVWHQSDRPNNVTVVHSVDVDACWDIILDSVKRCDASSTLNK